MNILSFECMSFSYTNGSPVYTLFSLAFFFPLTITWICCIKVYRSTCFLKAVQYSTLNIP